MKASTKNKTMYPTRVPVVDVGAIVGVAPVVNPLTSGATITNMITKRIAATVSPIRPFGVSNDMVEYYGK